MAITGTVGRNLIVAGGNVEIASSALVRGGVVAAGGSVDLAAPVEGAAIAAETLIIGNRIAGDVEAAVGTLRIGSKAEIGGNVNYWSGQEAAVSEGARINGKIVRNVPPEGSRIFPPHSSPGS